MNVRFFFALIFFLCGCSVCCAGLTDWWPASTHAQDQSIESDQSVSLTEQEATDIHVQTNSAALNVIWGTKVIEPDEHEEDHEATQSTEHACACQTQDAQEDATTQSSETDNAE